MKLFQQTKLKTLSIAIFALFAIGVGSIVTGDSAFAATKTWTGTSGSTFNTAGNWSPSGVPANGDDLVFNNTGGSTLVAQNNISALTVNSITLSGTAPVSITTSSAGNIFTLNGPVTSTTSGLSDSTILGQLVLGADVTVTNVSLAILDDDSVALGGHALTMKTNSGYGGSTISVGQIIGTGVFNIDVRNTVSIFLDNTNGYSGTTNLLSGVTSSLDDDSNTLFGTSSIVVSPTASLTLDALGASWTFNNAITLQQAIVGQSGFVEAQLYIWASQPNQVINIPNITLSGNSRFDLNDIGATGATVNLAGINAGSFCVQYGNDNNKVASFLNGPAACYIGDDLNAPDTAVEFIKANPFLIIGLGIVTAGFLTIIAIRSRSTK